MSTRPVSYVGIKGDPLSEAAIKILQDKGCEVSFIDRHAPAPHLSVLFASGNSERWPGRHARHVLLSHQGQHVWEQRFVLGVILRDNLKGNFSESVLNAARAAESLLVSSENDLPPKHPWLTTSLASVLQDVIYYERRSKGAWHRTEGLKIQKKPRPKRDRNRTRARRREMSLFY